MFLNSIAPLFLTEAESVAGLTDKITKDIEPVVQLVKSAIQAGLGIFTVIMAALAIPHCITFAKADDEQQKKLAKQKLSNLLVAFAAAFALLVLFTTLSPTLTDWYIEISSK